MPPSLPSRHVCNSVEMNAIFESQCLFCFTSGEALSDGLIANSDPAQHESYAGRWAQGDPPPLCDRVALVVRVSRRCRRLLSGRANFRALKSASCILPAIPIPNKPPIAHDSRCHGKTADNRRDSARNTVKPAPHWFASKADALSN